MYYTTDQDLIEDFHLRSGHSVGSKKSYRTVFNKYTAFHNMSLCDHSGKPIKHIRQDNLIQGLSNQKSYRKHNYKFNFKNQDILPLQQGDNTLHTAAKQ